MHRCQEVQGGAPNPNPQWMVFTGQTLERVEAISIALKKSTLYFFQVRSQP